MKPTTPYRELPASSQIKQKKKSCLLFHDWYPAMKPDRLAQILKDKKTINNRDIIQYDIMEDYILVCTSCGKEKEMIANVIYLELAIEDFKSKFRGSES